MVTVQEIREKADKIALVIAEALRIHGFGDVTDDIEIIEETKMGVSILLYVDRYRIEIRDEYEDED